MNTRSKKEKIVTYLVGAIIAVCSVIFIVTFVKASLYDPGDMGISTGISTRVRSTEAGINGNNDTTFAPASTSTVASTSISVIISTSYLESHSANPSRLIIPSLDINSHVQYVGINAKGNIGTPNNFTDVAWYSYGVVPGQAGTAVIDGHVDNGLGLAGVFKHLSNMQIGDEVDVITKAGKKIHFIVTDIETYDYQNVPSQAIFGTSSASSFLKLITCDGTWVQGSDTYNERLIVTATLVV
jgi:sortase (surface protein transpeptidase)